MSLTFITMGTSQSKEEVIIAQAGNSGGATGATNETTSLSAKEICEIVVTVLAVLVILAVFIRKCKKILERKIRAEIARSREEV